VLLQLVCIDVGWIIICLAASVKPADVGSTLEVNIDDVRFIFWPLCKGFVTAGVLARKAPLLKNMKQKSCKNRNSLAGLRIKVIHMLYRVSQKSLNGFARLYLRNPWDYRNGIGAKRCVLSLSFVQKF
jgi:hypothetical protein